MTLRFFQALMLWRWLLAINCWTSWFISVYLSLYLSLVVQHSFWLPLLSSFPLWLRSDPTFWSLLCERKLVLPELFRRYLSNDGQIFVGLRVYTVCGDRNSLRDSFLLKYHCCISLLLENVCPHLAWLSVLQEPECLHVWDRVGLCLHHYLLVILVKNGTVLDGHIRIHLSDQAVIACASWSAPRRSWPVFAVEGEHVLRPNFTVEDLLLCLHICQSLHYPQVFSVNVEYNAFSLD